MNTTQRKRIDAIMKEIDNSAAARGKIDAMIEELNERLSEYRALFDSVQEDIQTLRDEEQEKYDNLSDGLQQTEGGQDMEAAIQNLDAAIDACEEIAVIEYPEITFDVDAIITALDDAKV